MEILLIVTVCLSLSISAMCSLMEAGLYAVPYPLVKHLADQGSRSGRALLALKEDIGKPIAAILILNTISNTAGAAVAGALAATLFGETGLLVLSVLFTLLILYLSEIIPKKLGVLYAKQVAVAAALPLSGIVRLLWPLIVFSDWIVRVFQAKQVDEPSVSEEEVLSMADIGTEEGVLDRLEGSVIKNIVGLDRVLIKDILTPRVVVFRMPEDRIVGELKEEIITWRHSRVPLFSESDSDLITGYVTQRDIYRALTQGEENLKLSDLARPLHTISEFSRADKVLLQLFEQKEPIYSVVDEHGGFAGIVTLEDIIEEVVGREIVDEYDLVSDLRAYAQALYRIKVKRMKDNKQSTESSS